MLHCYLYGYVRPRCTRIMHCVTDSHPITRSHLIMLHHSAYTSTCAQKERYLLINILVWTPSTKLNADRTISRQSIAEQIYVPIQTLRGITRNFALLGHCLKFNSPTHTHTCGPPLTTHFCILYKCSKDSQVQSLIVLRREREQFCFK